MNSCRVRFSGREERRNRDHESSTAETMRSLNILLIRHGLTDSNAGGVIQGHLPVPLNEVGHAQARRLASRLTTFRPRVEALVSSDLARAAQTAEPIGRALGIPVRFDPAWRERNMGQWQGKTFADVDIWKAAAGEFDPPGAESTKEFRHRVREALVGLPGQFPQANTIAVVTHGGPVRMLLRMLVEGELACEGEKPELVAIANCSIMHLALAGGTHAIRCLNDVAHLDASEKTARDAG
jgi:2,3-bisphosphoglycerate-dependent phosphoglycerate mutase